jgi:hypothetical protein
VSDIAKGILGGGWSLVAGWILPTAINVLLFGFFVLPSLRSIPIANKLAQSGASDRSLAWLGASVVAGLTLNALQEPIYRILEGNLFWPFLLTERRTRRMAAKKKALNDRLYVLDHRKRLGRFTSIEKERFDAISVNPKLARDINRDKRRSGTQCNILRERLRRFPVNDNLIVPTRLGNAIRRLEEYGHDRYLIDSPVLWHELTAAVPEQIRRQINVAKSSVDFFVCLLCGNLLTAVLAVLSLSSSAARDGVLLVTAAVMIALAGLFYHLAVATTDDWARTTRALVDMGRASLAKSVGLKIPGELLKEREMWENYSRFVRKEYGDGTAGLDQFRIRLPKHHRSLWLRPRASGHLGRRPWPPARRRWRNDQSGTCQKLRPSSQAPG